MLFTNQSWWRKATLEVIINVNDEDYTRIPRSHPFWSSSIKVVTDTWAQSCLWGRQSFLNHGFKMSELAPVKQSFYAANKKMIKVGAVFLRLASSTQDEITHTADVIAYVHLQVNSTYLVMPLFNWMLSLVTFQKLTGH